MFGEGGDAGRPSWPLSTTFAVSGSPLYAWPLSPAMHRLYIGVRTITGGEWFLFAQTSPLPTSTCQGPNTCAREGKIDAYLHFTEEHFMYTLQGRAFAHSYSSPLLSTTVGDPKAVTGVEGTGLPGMAVTVGRASMPPLPPWVPFKLSRPESVRLRGAPPPVDAEGGDPSTATAVLSGLWGPAPAEWWWCSSARDAPSSGRRGGCGQRMGREEANMYIVSTRSTGCARV